MELRIDLNYVKHLKLLKVLILESLDFRGWKMRKSLKSIFKLVNLKYLSFRQSKMEEFPRSISNLTSLVILDLRLSSKEVVIRNVIWRMTNLKQLYLPDDFRDTKEQIQLVGQLDKLEVLHGVDSSVMDICSIITQLKNLRDLSATVKEDYKALSALIVEIKNMHHLQRIKFVIENFDFTSEQGSSLLEQMLTSCPSLYHLQLWWCQIKKFPECSDMLTSLELIVCQLEKDPMEMLGRFPNLRELTLRYSSFDGFSEICCASGSFPELRRLELSNLKDLETWTIGEDNNIIDDGYCGASAMPKLSSLSIYRCPKLEILPDGLRFITTLKELQIWEMPSEFKKRAEKGGEDFHKVQHVPSIYFWFCN